MLAGFEPGGSEAKMPDWSRRRRLQEEYEALGFCPGEHILEERMDEFRTLGVVPFTTAQVHQGKRFRLCGLPVHLRSLNSNGRESIVGLFEDPSSLFEVSFPGVGFRATLREVRRSGAAILEGIVGRDQSPFRVTDVRAVDPFA
jgi:DNA polymerase III alpha subunit